MLKARGVTSPSAIQRLALPFLLRWWDPQQGKAYAPPTVAIQDYTGSGKTLAYSIPLLASVDNYVDSKLLPPQVTGAIHRLRGIPLPPPPPRTAELAPLRDERARATRLEYRESDAMDPDAELAAQLSGERPAQADPNATADAAGYAGAGAGASAGPNSVEARARVRRNAYLRQKLREVFPSLPDSALDPEAPQSRLQGIVVVPTKELALQVAETLRAVNGSGSKQRRKHPVVVTACAGRVTARMLHDLGLQLRKAPGDADAEDAAAAAAPAPFVEFGRGHRNYRPDQDVARSLAAAREREDTMRELVLVERAQEVQRLEVVIKEAAAERQALLAAAAGRGLRGGDDVRPQLGRGSDSATRRTSTTAAVAADDVMEAILVDASGNPIDNAPAAGSTDEAEMSGVVLASATPAELPLLLRARAQEAEEGVYRHHAMVVYEDQRRATAAVAARARGRRGADEDAETDADGEPDVPLPDEVAPEVDIAVDPAYQAREDARVLRAEQRRRDAGQWDARAHANSGSKTSGAGAGTGAAGAGAKPRFTPEDLEREMSYESAAYAPLVAQLGGAPDAEVEADLSRQPHIVVGTPETLAALVRSGALQLPSTAVSPNQLRFTVFDEVDHLARNEQSTGHRAVLELMSLPTDQTIFVSASMTRETSVFMTRMARRQHLFGFTGHPTLAPTTELAAVPAPSAETQRRVARLGLPTARSPADAAAECVFLTPEDYRAGETAGENSAAGGRALPLPPYLRHYYLRVPRGADRYKTVMDVLCQFKHATAATRRLKSSNPAAAASAAAAEAAAAEAAAAAAADEAAKAAAGASVGASAPNAKAAAALAAESARLRMLLDAVSSVTVDERAFNAASGAHGSAGDDFIPIAGLQRHSVIAAPAAQSVAEAGAATAADGVAEPAAAGGPPTAAEVCPGGVLVFFNKSDPVQPEPGRGASGVGMLQRLRDSGIRTGAFTDRSDRRERLAVLRQTSTALATAADASPAALRRVKASALDVILATEGIARGMDMPALSLVINADVPRSTASYLHRAGRVARLGGQHRRKGAVLSLISEDDDDAAAADAGAGTGKDRRRAGVRGGVPIDDEALLRKHGHQLGVTIQPWPFALEPGLHRAYMRREEALVQEQKQQRVRQIKHLARVDAMRAASPRATAGVRVDVAGDGSAPGSYRATVAPRAAAQTREARSRRVKSVADTRNWMSWDSDKKGWKV
jgi:superfamily II DNA/RNA helicase